MPIETTCSGCKRTLRVADQHAGKKARCPHCSTVYQVPSPSGPASPGPASPGSASPGPASPGPASPGPAFGSGAAPTLTPLGASAPAQWRLMTEDGQVYGPVPKSDLDSWVTQGRVTPNSRVQQEGLDWQMAGAIYPSLQPQPAAAANPFSDLNTPAPNPYAPSTTSYPSTYPAGGQSRRYPPPHRGVLVLMMSIMGWFLCDICTIIALILGAIDLGKMNRGEMDPSGKGLTIAGIVIACIRLVFFVVLLVGVAVMIALEP